MKRLLSTYLHHRPCQCTAFQGLSHPVHSTAAFSMLLTPMGRQFCSSKLSIAKSFQEALERAKPLPPVSDNEMKLSLYALYKRATIGENTTPKPGMLDFVGKVKWEAWKKLNEISKEEAMQRYIAIIDKLEAQANTSRTTSDDTVSSDELVTSISDNGVFTIQLNRPKQFNALTLEMYNGISKAIEEAEASPHVRLILFTGNESSPYFSSGNDLNTFTKAISSKGVDINQLANDGAKLLETTINSFILAKKPIIARCHAPAVGIGATLLFLCDFVYIGDNVTIEMPFTKLGMTPEACSSYLLPRLVGRMQASAMLLLGDKITAQQAVDHGLVTESFNSSILTMTTNEKIRTLLSRSQDSLIATKALLRSPEVVKQMQAVNKQESEILRQRWLSPEFAAAMTSFATRKKNA